MGLSKRPEERIARTRARHHPIFRCSLSVNLHLPSEFLVQSKYSSLPCWKRLLKSIRKLPPRIQGHTEWLTLNGKEMLVGLGLFEPMDQRPNSCLSIHEPLLRRFQGMRHLRTQAIPFLQTPQNLERFLLQTTKIKEPGLPHLPSISTDLLLALPQQAKDLTAQKGVKWAA